MEQSLYWEAHSRSAEQENFPPSIEPEISLLFLQELSADIDSEPVKSILYPHILFL